MYIYMVLFKVACLMRFIDHEENGAPRCVVRYLFRDGLGGDNSSYNIMVLMDQCVMIVIKVLEVIICLLSSVYVT